MIAEILKIEKPGAGWPGARVLDAPNAGAGGGTVTYELAKRFTANERAAMEFAGAEKDQIAPLVVRATRSRSRGSARSRRPTGTNALRTLARVSVGNVVDKGDHRAGPGV